MLITKEIEIDMGHRVPNHKSECRNFHGHRYKIEVGVDDKVCVINELSDEGMVIDFGDLKQIMIDVIDKFYDHSLILYEKDEWVSYFDDMRDSGMKINIVDFIPTVENLTRHWFEVLMPILEVSKIRLHHVKVWETPTSTATYTMYNYAEDNR